MILRGGVVTKSESQQHQRISIISKISKISRIIKISKISRIIKISRINRTALQFSSFMGGILILTI